MAERVLLLRPLTHKVLHTEVAWENGTDTRKLSEPGDISFSLPISWQDARDADGDLLLAKRQTLVVVEEPGGTFHKRHIRHVGLVDDLTPTPTTLEVSCGGLSMVAAQAGPWEGHQGWYTSTDPLDLFREVWDQVQSYDDAKLGLRVTGDTSTGSMVGSVGSARWRKAYREHRAMKPKIDRLEARHLDHERVLTRRKEEMFKAAGLRRVGDVTVAEARPDDPGYKADSTLWIRESDRLAHVWTGERWHSRSAANNAVAWWFTSTSNLEKVKAELDEAKYEFEPIEADLEAYEDEAREEFTLYFWQDHNPYAVIEKLLELGPFEYREQAAWSGEELDLQLYVKSPKIGVRRTNLHLELDVNVLEPPPLEAGEEYTGLTLFGAGQGSEVLSEQRHWKPKHTVRNVLVETDKDAHTKSQTRSAATKLERELKKATGLGFTQLIVHHDERCPVGSFQVGDEIPVTGRLSSGADHLEWYRVLSITRPWGTKRSELEVEKV